MITKLKIIKSDKLHPYYNQAIEASLLDIVDDETAILYIWANDKTVVIGKNQNAFTECNVQKLKEVGGLLARRISGGGAVYHDKGNLNFTFLATKKNYSITDNFNILLHAVRSFSINAELSGRNDCVIDGKKFSGNAFYSSGYKCFHHGTVLINTASGEIAKYLNVSDQKLLVKGIKSVSSRVTNLIAYNDRITYEKFSEKLEESFSMYYQNAKVEKLDIFDIDNGSLLKWHDHFSNQSFIMGDDAQFDYRLEHKFDWGLCDIRYSVENDIIKKAKIYTDSLIYDISKKEEMLIGKDITSAINCEVSDILTEIRLNCLKI